MEIKEDIKKLLLDFKRTSERMAREKTKFREVERKFYKEATTFIEKQRVDLDLLNAINEKIEKYLKEKNKKELN